MRAPFCVRNEQQGTDVHHGPTRSVAALNEASVARPRLHRTPTSSAARAISRPSLEQDRLPNRSTADTDRQAPATSGPGSAPCRRFSVRPYRPRPRPTAASIVGRVGDDTSIATPPPRPWWWPARHSAVTETSSTGAPSLEYGGALRQRLEQRPGRATTPCCIRRPAGQQGRQTGAFVLCDLSDRSHGGRDNRALRDDDALGRQRLGDQGVPHLVADLRPGCAGDRGGVSLCRRRHGSPPDECGRCRLLHATSRRRRSRLPAPPIRPDTVHPVSEVDRKRQRPGPRRPMSRLRRPPTRLIDHGPVEMRAGPRWILPD